MAAKNKTSAKKPLTGLAKYRADKAAGKPGPEAAAAEGEGA